MWALVFNKKFVVLAIFLNTPNGIKVVRIFMYVCILVRVLSFVVRQ